MFTPMFALLVKVPLLSVGRRWVYWHHMKVAESTDCWAQEKRGVGRWTFTRGEGRLFSLSAIITFLPKGVGVGEET